MLNRLVRQLGALKYLFADNGGEFAGRLVDLEAYHHGVRIDFSRPGKPTDNACIETSYGSFRDECLNLHWFAAIGEARRVIEAWRREYNESRPHMALGNPLPSPYPVTAKHHVPSSSLTSAVCSWQISFSLIPANSPISGIQKRERFGFSLPTVAKPRSSSTQPR
jgi:transposase InsO family protein